MEGAEVGPILTIGVFKGPFVPHFFKEYKKISFPQIQPKHSYIAVIA